MNDLFLISIGAFVLLIVCVYIFVLNNAFKEVEQTKRQAKDIKSYDSYLACLSAFENLVAKYWFVRYLVEVKDIKEILEKKISLI